MQAIEGFWEDAIVIARSEAEHNFRIGEDDYQERNAGHMTKIMDIKSGDFVMCQSGGFTRVLSVVSMTRRIEDWLKVESGEAPLYTLLKAEAAKGTTSFNERSLKWNVEIGRTVTYCTGGMEVLTDEAFMEGERTLREKGMFAYTEECERYNNSEVSKISQKPLSAYRRISEDGITLFCYDCDAATELCEKGVIGTDTENVEYCVLNLGMTPALQTFKPITKAVDRVPAGSLRAYALVTEHGTYVADGLYAKSPEK